MRRAPRHDGPAALARSATAEPTELRAPADCGAAPKMLIAVRALGRAGATAKADDVNEDTLVGKYVNAAADDDIDDDDDSATRTSSHCDSAPAAAVRDTERAGAAATDPRADDDDDTDDDDDDDDDCACLPSCEALERRLTAAGPAAESAANAPGADCGKTDDAATTAAAAADDDDDSDDNEDTAT